MLDALPLQANYRKYSSMLFTCLLLIAIVAFVSPAKAQLKVFSYYNYASTGIQPWQLDCSQFTHLLWAFAHLQENGKISLEGPPNFPNNEKDATQTIYPGSPKCTCNDNCLQGQLGILFRMKNSCPHVKILVSVGYESQL
jgi:GH18 family chitinase